MDDDGIRLPANSIQLFSGTIVDPTDPIVDATLTYAEPGLQSGHKVDGSLITTTDAAATLSALALSGVTLAPTFVSSTETYTATVGNAVTETTVTATPTHSGATVAFKDGDNNALTNPVTLAVGANVIKAVVTAEDTTTMKTYMVTVTRAGTTTYTCLAPNLAGRTEVWRGTITVGMDDFSFGYFHDGPDVFGKLSPDNFDYGGNNYTIMGIRERVLSGSMNKLELDLDVFPPDSDRDKLRLHLCDYTVDLTAATKIVSPFRTYQWSNAVVDWSGATTIEAALSGTIPAPAIVTNGVQVTSTPTAMANTYGLDELIAITVTFDKAVTVGGTPRIAFRLDGDPNPNRWAEYSSGSGGTAVVFTYTVQADDRDADGIWLPANTIELFSGTIRDATDNTVDATLTYAEPGLQSGHKVDGSLTTTTNDDDGTDDGGGGGGGGGGGRRDRR